MIDMTGWIMKEHGISDSKLTVLEKTDKRLGGQIIWKCQCECGNICEVSGYLLRKGLTRSCGCLCAEKAKVKDLTGKQFGYLTVIEDTGKRTFDHRVIWKCKCSCGNECEVAGSYLTSGNTQSCGCIKSRGEAKISQILRDNNFSFEAQKTFENCRFKNTNALAKFDLYVNNKYIIEYDGIQHFIERNGGWGESLEDLQQRDRIKNQYCFDHNIPIIRIPYTHLNNLCLEDLLLETSQFLLKHEE